jgi:predicted transposase YbfD/YdcC
VPAASSCSTLVSLDHLPSHLSADQVADLRTYFAAIPDPRHRRGIRHPLTAILAITAAAVAAGARSFTAIAEWAADAPQLVLARLGARFDPRQARYQAPDEATLRRVTQRLDGDHLDAAISAWLANQDHPTTEHPSAAPAAITPAAIAVDGKSLRGTFPRNGGAGIHLLSAFTHDTGTVLAQRHVTVGTSEITWFPILLDDIDLTGQVVTADALHTVADHARYLHTRGADYVFTVKENQHRLYHQLDALPWHEAPTLVFTERGHGRSEKRTVQVLPLGDYVGFTQATFPHATHAFLIERYVTHHTTRQHTAHAALGVTSLTGPAAHPAQIHTYVRGQWQIENRLHWVRDVTFGEDASRVRTGSAPRVMASLRNLAISALRLTGQTNLAKALRHLARNPYRPLDLLGMNS